MTNTDSGTARPAAGWGWVLAYGVIVLLVGLLAFLNPIATGLATGILFGLLLVAYGVLALIAGFSSLSHRSRWIELLLGVLGILAGAMTLFNPFLGALSLVTLIGAWLLVSGIFEIVSGFTNAHDRIWRVVLGLLDMILGGILLFSGPATGLFFLAFCIGISFLFRGVFLVMLAFGLRKIGRG